MKSIKKLIVTFLVLVLLLSYVSYATTTVQAAPQVPNSMTYYLTNKPYITNLTINGWYKIKKSAVKSSNKKIVEINDVTRVEGKAVRALLSCFLLKSQGRQLFLSRLTKRNIRQRSMQRNTKIQRNLSLSQESRLAMRQIWPVC